MPNKSGFSLVELLVIVSLITVLSVVGLVMFQSARGKAQEAKYRGDVDAIKKAYEKNYDASLNNGQGGYKPLSPSDFVDNKIPTDKAGNQYIVTQQTTGVITSYAACINPITGVTCLGPNSPACTCAVSTQGSGTQFSTITASTCDPYGVLGNGLVGYWKMDEPSWNSTSGEVDDFVSDVNGTGLGGANTISGKFVRAGNFDGVNDYVGFSKWPNIPGSSFSISAWFKSANSFRMGGQQYCGNMPFMLTLNGNNAVFAVNNAAGFCGNSQVNYTANINSSLWNQAVGTFDGTNARLYINGTLVGTGANFTGLYITSHTEPFVFGRYDCSVGCRYGSGQIDDVRVYNRALSQVEIANLWNNGESCIP